MTSRPEHQSYGIPAPITELTVEQEFQMKKLELRIKSGEVKFEDLATVFMAIQHQNFVLSNSITNLVHKWPKVQPTINEELSMFGILLENKN
jgi:hypothetical protein